MNNILLNLLRETDYTKLNKLIKIGLISQEEVTNQIIKDNNPIFMYKFARYADNLPSHLLERLTDSICMTDDSNSIWAFAYKVKNANISKLADAMCNIGDPSNIYYFALKINNPPINKLADAMCKTNSPEHIYLFAKAIPNAPIDKLSDAIMKTNDFRYICEFIKRVIGAPVQKIVDYVLENRAIFLEQNQAAKYFYDILCYSNFYRVEEIIDIVIGINDVKYIYHVANVLQYKNTKNSKLFKKLVNAILQIGDAIYIKKLNHLINMLNSDTPNYASQNIEPTYENIRDINRIYYGEMLEGDPSLPTAFELLVISDDFDFIESRKELFANLLSEDSEPEKGLKM